MKMVRSSMLAAVAGVLISPALLAGDINSASEKTGWTDELLGLANAADVVTGGALTLILNAEFAVNDVITLSFSGDALDGTTVPTTVVTDGLGGCSTLTLGLLSADSGTATYRVTEIDTGTGTTTVGCAIPFADAGDLEFAPAAVAANSGVSVSYAAETNNGLPLDTGSGPAIAAPCAPNCNARTTPYIQTAAQFGVETGPVFDAVVDVNTQRTTLIPGPDDIGQFNATNNNLAGAADTAFEGVDTVFHVDFVDHDPTFSGNFGWITDVDETTEGIQPGLGVVTVGGACASFTVTASEIAAVDCASPFASLTLDPSAQAPDLTTLPATSYTAATDLNYLNGVDGFPANTNEGTLAVTGVSVGAWDLNGFQAEVAYMPFQSGISQVIYIANRSSQTGAITVDWIDADGNSGVCDVGVVNAGSTRAIGPAINQCLPSAQRASGRLALTITANVPACDAQLNAQYNVSGDRAFSVATNNCPVSAVVAP